MGDIKLIVRAQQGNKDAFRDLMEIHYRTVEKFAYQCGVHLDDIPDVTQEVFIKLYRFLHQFNHERFTTSLYKSTLNTARDYYRKKVNALISVYDDALFEHQKEIGDALA